MTLDHTIRQRILEAVDAGFDSQLAFTADMVRHDSTRGNEAAMQEFMAHALRERGLAVDHWKIKIADIENLPGFSPVVDADYEQAFNVVGTHHPKAVQQGRSLIINGHVDVVPVNDEKRWTTPPFEPRIEDGYMYGRGAGDMKAGLAAGIFALDALHSVGLAPAAPVQVQSVVEEECTGNGTLACLQRGYRADCAFIPEPLEPRLTCGQIGLVWFRVVVRGDPQHASAGFNEVGTNAIEKAIHIWPYLKQLEQEWNARKVDHPVYKDHPYPIRVNLGEISGGDWTSSVPATATLSVRVGVLPGVDLASIRAEIEARVKAASQTDPFLASNPPSVVYHGHMSEGYVLEDAELPKQVLADCHAAAFEQPLESVVTSAATDARFFGLYQNTPAIVYGPVCKRPHGIDECVELDSVRKITQTMALFIAEWCGIERIDD